MSRKIPKSIIILKVIVIFFAILTILIGLFGVILSLRESPWASSLSPLSSAMAGITVVVLVFLISHQRRNPDKPAD